MLDLFYSVLCVSVSFNLFFLSFFVVLILFLIRLSSCDIPTIQIKWKVHSVIWYINSDESKEADKLWWWRWSRIRCWYCCWCCCLSSIFHHARHSFTLHVTYARWEKPVARCTRVSHGPWVRTADGARWTSRVALSRSWSTEPRDKRMLRPPTLCRVTTRYVSNVLYIWLDWAVFNVVLYRSFRRLCGDCGISQDCSRS